MQEEPIPHSSHFTSILISLISLISSSSFIPFFPHFSSWSSFLQSIIPISRIILCFVFLCSVSTNASALSSYPNSYHLSRFLPFSLSLSLSFRWVSASILYCLISFFLNLFFDYSFFFFFFFCFYLQISHSFCSWRH